MLEISILHGRQQDKRLKMLDQETDQNSTGQSWMDELSDGEIMFYQNFLLSS